MAGPLTWRDVSAPDFSASMQGIGQFSQMLGNALGGADKALTEWDDNKTDEVSKKFMLDLFSKYDTPEKFAAAQADGSLMEGMDTSRLNAPAMEFLFGRPNALLDTEGKRLDNTGQGLINENQIQETKIRGTEFGWKTDDRAAVDAAKPFAFQMLQSVTAPGKDGGEPTPAEINERMGLLQKDPNFATVMGNLTPDQQMAMYTNPVAVLKGTLGIRADRQGIRQNDLNYKKGEWELEAAKADRADQTAGMAAAREAIEGGGGDPETARSILAKKNLTPGAFAVAMNQVTGTYGNVYSPESYGGIQDSSGNPIGAPGGAPPVGSGFSHPLGGRGTTVSGGQFGAPRSYGGHSGVDYADVAGTDVFPIREGVVTKSYFDKAYGHRVEIDHGGGVITTYSHMDGRNVRPGMHVGLKTRLGGVGNTGSASRGNHLHLEAIQGGKKVNPSSLVSANRPRDNLDGAVAISQGNTVRNSRVWGDKITDTSNANQVANALTTGPLKGAPVPWVSAKLNDIVRRSGGKLNYAQAGDVLHGAMTKDPDELSISGVYGRNAPRFLGGNFGDGRDQINESFIDQRIDDAKGNRYQDQVRRDSSIEQAAGIRDAAEREYQAAWAERQKYIRAVQTNPKARNEGREAKINARLDVATGNLEDAKANYSMTVNSADKEPEVKQTWGDAIGGMFTIRREKRE